MAPPLILIGPPSINHRPSSTSGSSINPSPPTSPPENHSSTLNPPKNPCLDLFFYKPNSLGNLTELIERAYSHDPLTALKLICNLRSVSGTGAFLSTLVWLHQNHPLTLACNIRVFVKFMSLKELLQILVRILESKGGESIIGEKSEKGNALKKTNNIAWAKRVVERYKSDSNFRFLHNQISKLFADLLNSDIRFLNSGQIEKISAASRFCPSLDSSFDKLTLICEGIARKLFPRESDPEYRDVKEQINEAHYAFRVRDRLRKQVLVPLRRALDSAKANSISELKIHKPILNKKGTKLFKVYQSNYWKIFSGDDNERFRLYLDIAHIYHNRGTAGYVPQEIVASLNDKHSDDEIVELEWHKLVEDLSKKGQRGNCIGICNVSERMKDSQIDFSIAMGLIISELNEEPWKGKVVTYGPNPELRKVEGHNLRSKVNFMKQMKCGDNIHFSKVFEELLRVALAENVSEEQMVKRIFVFTHMGFEKAANNFWAVWASLRKYQSKGYKSLPEIVFWNLREGVMIPEAHKHKGLVMVTGFSKSSVAMLLEKGVFPTPESVAEVAPKPEEVMNWAICRDEYRDLIVFD
ncbi:hypothetical protein LguiA_027337 [Lonicera macranthoides]